MRQQECNDYQSSFCHVEAQHDGFQMDLVGDHIEHTSYVLVEAFASQQNQKFENKLERRSTLETAESSEPSESNDSFHTAQDSTENVGHNLSFAELVVDDLPEDDAEMERLFNTKFGCDTCWVEENKKTNKLAVDIRGVKEFFGKLFA